VGKYLKFMAWVTGILLVVVLFFRLTMMNAWQIPVDPVLGASLAPSLAEGDTVLIFTAGEPSFGDLVRCADPDDTSRWVIGRIVGVGGDVIKFENNTLSVNGTRHVTKESCPDHEYFVAHPNSGERVQILCDRIEIAGGWHYAGSVPQSQNAPFEATVDRDYVYLLSDNREFHEDSRDFGQVPKNTCNESIFFRLWGLEGWGDTESRMTFIH